MRRCSLAALIGLAASGAVALACSSFGSDTGSSSSTSDAASPNDAGATDASLSCDSARLCEDFERDAPLVVPPWSGTDLSYVGGTLVIGPDAPPYGRVLHASTAPAPTGASGSTLLQFQYSGAGVTSAAFRADIRVAPPTFATGYSTVATLECPPPSGNQGLVFAVVHDSRGLSLVLDTSAGDVVGFVKDGQWHRVEVTITTTSAELALDGVPFSRLTRTTTFGPTCVLRLGEAPREGAPQLDAWFDNVRLD